jgi:hypothetical protein
METCPAEKRKLKGGKKGGGDENKNFRKKNLLLYIYLWCLLSSNNAIGIFRYRL